MGYIYPPISTYDQQMLPVSHGHSLYIEQSGNPDGIPVLYLHGGPGSGLSADYRRYFNPQRYRIIGFDQRGCGQSTPFCSLENNTTAELLDDIQVIRKHLGVKKWLLSGGSWGTTLALLSAIQHPEAVIGMILRGVFLARQQDLDWFVGDNGGAAQIFPDHFQSFAEIVSNREPGVSLVDAYHELFLNGDELTRTHAAKNWCLWEERISTINSSVMEHDLANNLHQAASMALLECHYIKHGCFIEENYIMQNIDKISHIPGTIIHGRYDMVCKLQGAFELSKAWRNCQLLITPESGHSGSEPRISEALGHATEAMAKFIKESKH